MNTAKKRTALADPRFRTIGKAITGFVAPRQKIYRPRRGRYIDKPCHFFTNKVYLQQRLGVG